MSHVSLQQADLSYCQLCRAPAGQLVLLLDTLYGTLRTAVALDELWGEIPLACTGCSLVPAPTLSCGDTVQLQAKFSVQVSISTESEL